MKKLSLLIADIVILYGALAVTLLIRYPGDFSVQVALHATPFSLLFAIWIIIFYINSLYDIQNLRNTSSFYATLLRSIFIAGALAVGFFYVTPIFGITPKVNLFLFLVLFSLLEVVNRTFFNAIIQKRFHKRTMIVGINPISRELVQFIKQNPQLGYELRHIVDITPETPKDSGDYFSEFKIIQGLEDIGETIRREKISIVILSPEAYQVKEIIEIFYRALEHRVNFHNLTTMYEKITGRVSLGTINQVWFLENIAEGHKQAYERIKRALDIFFATILGFFTIILTPFIALAIRIDSKGPIFYRHKRVGQLGREFEIVKFRSMEDNAEQKTGAVWTQKDDPRITRVGNFIRKTRLDELPQLWNVLKGEQSLIGPRPERPEFHEILKKEIPFYEERYLIRPGLTGLSQLHIYGASVFDAAVKLQYDLYYIKNRSLMLDAGIFLKTLNLILRGGGR